MTKACSRCGFFEETGVESDWYGRKGFVGICHNPKGLRTIPYQEDVYKFGFGVLPSIGSRIVTKLAADSYCKRYKLKPWWNKPNRENEVNE